MAKKDVQRYISNPLNSFLLIKRLTAELELIENLFPEESEEFFKDIKNLRPEKIDLSGAVEGLLRLQTVYKLKSDDFAKGIIDEEITRSALSPHDLFVIGEEAFKLKEQDFFVKEYLNLAWDMIEKKFDADQEVDLNDLLFYLTTSYNRTGDYANAIKTFERFILNNPDYEEGSKVKQALADNLQKHGNSKLSLIDPYVEDFAKDGHFTKEKEFILYRQACRRVLKKRLKEQAELQCRYVSNSAFSVLARFKIEEVNLDPLIVLFIDVISDAEIEILKNLTKPAIDRAQTGSDVQESIKSSFRVSKSAGHKDRKHKVLQKLSRRVEVRNSNCIEKDLQFFFKDMTGLAQRYVEGFEVQNYGIGGHYITHWDCYTKWEKPFDDYGNRIATVLFYVRVCFVICARKS